MAIRIGIIGCGGIARAHRDAYRAAGAEVVAVQDAAPEVAERFAAECGAHAVGSLSVFLESGIDAASVCTPPGAHAEACLALIARGIPVLCEKPLAADLVGARMIAEAARRSLAPFMVGFCHRHHGAVLELKRLLDAGSLGAPVLTRIAFAGEFPLAGNHRADPRLAGGGCIADNGAHAVDLFRFLIGDIAEARGMIANVAQQASVEDAGIVTLRARGGSLGEIATSFSAPIGVARIEVLGSAGTAILTYWTPGEPELRWQRRGEPKWTEVDCSRHPDRFAAQARHFLDCVRSGAPCSPSIEDGLAAAIAIDAAYASARRLAAGAAHG
jgi:predicted dehydrogenase